MIARHHVGYMAIFHDMTGTLQAFDM